MKKNVIIQPMTAQLQLLHEQSEMKTNPERDLSKITGYYQENPPEIYVCDDENYYKLEKPLQYLIHNDYIDYDLQTNKHTLINRTSNLICGILNIKSSITFGFTNKRKPKKLFMSFDKRMTNFIVPIQNNNYFSNDIYVMIKFEYWNTTDKYPTGSIEHIIGEIGDINAERNYLKLICTCKWINNKKLNFNNSHTIERSDFSNYNVFSIDPDDCKDIDDAIHIVKYDNFYEIGVHIADVSTFIVSKDIDAEIEKRSQSLYLATEKVNMLPNDLAENFYSLIQNEKRNCFSVLFYLDVNHNSVKEPKFLHTHIINKKNYTYDEASIIIDNNSNINETDNDLKLLAKLFSRTIDAKGTNVTNDMLAVKGTNVTNDMLAVKGTNVTNDMLAVKGTNVTNDTHKLIEKLMVLTNTTVAKKISQTPTYLLRKHENNDIDDVTSNSLINSKIKLLQSHKAEYTTKFYRHDGLDADVYTHFTSPIRRYADIIVHRLLDCVMNDKEKFAVDKNIFWLNQTEVLHKKIQLNRNYLNLHII